MGMQPYHSAVRKWYKRHLRWQRRMLRRLDDFIAVKQNFYLAAGLMVVFVLCALGALVAVLLQFTKNTQPTQQGSTVVLAQAADCGSAVLLVDTTAFPVTNLPRIPGSPLLIPPNADATAYRVEGPAASRVYGLSPAPSAQGLREKVQPGDIIQLYWAACPVETYKVRAVSMGQPAEDALFAGQGSALQLFLQDSPSGQGYWVQAGPVVQAGPEELAGPENVDVENAGQGGAAGEAQPQPENAPADASPTLVLPAASTEIPPPDPNAIEAEISLLEVSSPDSKTLQVQISVYNYNTTSFTMQPSDVRLNLPDGRKTALTRANPALPLTILPGQAVTLALTFPRPPASVVEFQVFTALFELEGY